MISGPAWLKWPASGSLHFSLACAWAGHFCSLLRSIMVGHIITLALIISIAIVTRSLTGEACPTSRRHERGILRLGIPLFVFGCFSPLLC